MNMEQKQKLHLWGLCRPGEECGFYYKNFGKELKDSQQMKDLSYGFGVFKLDFFILVASYTVLKNIDQSHVPSAQSPSLATFCKTIAQYHN